nr:protein artichoke-like isoform X1 [Danaus plexippus plexippus]XP_032530183.1 protein artichoke-like isoform X1 [Danaus plexippus plexippus]XP_032530185.1 protein artichoke-like isoform X1 [Danaus plexippus plexippus]
MDFKAEKILLWFIIVFLDSLSGQKTICPPPETISPCICTHRQEDIQIWCTHSDLAQVMKGIQKIGEYIKKPIDEIIIENNYLPSLPGKIFQNLNILRLMLRQNGLERVSATWLETQEMNLLEIFIVESDLKSIPSESLMKLQNLQALTIQSENLKRIPVLMNMQKLRYVNIQSNSLNAIYERTFENLPSLERLFIRGSVNLQNLNENAFYNLPKLRKLDITNCGITTIHMRAFSLLPKLSELALNNNKISDASMVGRATRDLPMLSTLNLSDNIITKLNEAAFVDLPMLEVLYLTNNNINIIHHGAFYRVAKLRKVDLNYNEIIRIHPESFLQQSGSGVEDLSLIGNQIMHISEFRSLLDALPRLRYLDMSENLLQEIPRGALRGHPSLERLHLNTNNIKFIDKDAFLAMPALRELHLSNNSLNDLNEGPFWNLPALKGLDLSYNYFQRLQPKLLFNLPALRRINLSNNQLTIIDPITFMETPLLEYVNISGNSLVSIHPATFRNLPNLYELDASSNRLVEFVPGLPRGLEQLYLNKNQITTLPIAPSPDLDLPSLRTLDISSNGIQKISHGGMKTLHNLRRLYMKRNGVRQIDIGTFSNLERLEELDLSHNQIISIDPKSFSNLAYLKQINLLGNNIENLDFTTIQNNGVLSTVDFSKNKIKSINPVTMSKGLKVEILNISMNNLHELPGNLNMLSTLKTLDLSNNFIKSFDGNIINSIHTLETIKMHRNRIVELRPGTFRDLINLGTIDLENNQLEAIHSLAIASLPNLVSIYLSNNHIIDIPDRAFSNLPKLRVIDLQGNRLQFISMRAFDSIPLVQYLNLSNNQITTLDNLGIRPLMSLEVLDLSFNRITRITKESFKYMEWLVELNLDNNNICYITNQPFDYMPRLKVLSLRNNKLHSVHENNFAKLRSNIAILDIDGNPLVCNCAIIWLKSWLTESTSIGPKCSDGTYVKEMPFSKSDCDNIPIQTQDPNSCLSYENEALLPNLQTSQVFSSLDKIKDYGTHIKHNYNGNKLSNRPLPEESEYFYDEYVDYPYNETLLENINNEFKVTNKSMEIATSTPSNQIGTINRTNLKSGVAVKLPTSGFTFFGLPLPSLDMNKLLNTGRKIDLFENKNSQKHVKNYQVTEAPRFETGGFSPMLPATSAGFKPIPNPALNVSQMAEHSIVKVDQNNKALNNLSPMGKVFNNTSHKKIKSEFHELEAYHNDDNKTQIAYNRTKNIEEQDITPINISKYNLMETNMTVTQVTEKEMIITTDVINTDLSLQAWIETSSMLPSSTTTSLPIVKHVDSEPTALSSTLDSNIEDFTKNHSRTATITKVVLPHAEHYDLRHNYAPVMNREAKTQFFEVASTHNKVKSNDDNDWYYKNYNKTNIDPYIDPVIQTSSSYKLFCYQPTIILTITMTVLNNLNLYIKL